MRFVAYLMSFVVVNVVAVLAATLILRIQPITWLLETYGWSEFAINFFAYLIGSYAGLQGARWICLKVAKSEIGPIAMWLFALPFALLGVAEIFVRNNLMGAIGAAGALAGVALFKAVIRDEQEARAHRITSLERTS